MNVAVDAIFLSVSAKTCSVFLESLERELRGRGYAGFLQGRGRETGWFGSGMDVGKRGAGDGDNITGRRGARGVVLSITEVFRGMRAVAGGDRGVGVDAGRFAESWCGRCASG